MGEDSVFLAWSSWGVVMLFAEAEKTRGGTGGNEELHCRLSVASLRVGFSTGVPFLTILLITQESLKRRKMVSETVPGLGERRPCEDEGAHVGGLCPSMMVVSWVSQRYPKFLYPWCHH